MERFSSVIVFEVGWELPGQTPVNLSVPIRRDAGLTFCDDGQFEVCQLWGQLLLYRGSVNGFLCAYRLRIIATRNFDTAAVAS